MPTLLPTWNLVPRSRTMIVPGRTVSPPKRFTPSRRPLLSRPFPVLPAAFLLAIHHPLTLIRICLHRLSRERGPRTQRVHALPDYLGFLAVFFAVAFFAPVFFTVFLP